MRPGRAPGGGTWRRRSGRPTRPLDITTFRFVYIYSTCQTTCHDWSTYYRIPTLIEFAALRYQWNLRRAPRGGLDEQAAEGALQRVDAEVLFEIILLFVCYVLLHVMFIIVLCFIIIIGLCLILLFMVCYCCLLCYCWLSLVYLFDCFVLIVWLIAYCCSFSLCVSESIIYYNII